MGRIVRKERVTQWVPQGHGARTKDSTRGAQNVLLGPIMS